MLAGAAQRVTQGFEALMVPLVMLTLAVVIASQISDVRTEFAALLRVVPLYVVYVWFSPRVIPNRPAMRH